MLRRPRESSPDHRLHEISVVIPTWNSLTGSKCIDRTIRSALSQEGVAVEVIVVDNRSDDGTREVCEQLGVQFYSVPSTRSEARNFGLERATGTFVLFLDSDHELEAGALAASVRLAEEWDLDAVFLGHTYVVRNKKGNISPSTLNLELEIREPNWIPNLYRTHSIRGLAFDPALDFGEDFVFFEEFKTRAPRLGKLGWGLIHYDPPDFTTELRRSYAYGRSLRAGPPIAKAHQLLFEVSIANGFSPSGLLRILRTGIGSVIRLVCTLGLKYAAFCFGYIAGRGRAK